MTPRSAGADAPAGAPSVPLLVAAAVLVVGVVVAVLAFGVQSPPTVEPLEEATGAPDIALAWLAHDGGESCLHVAWPDGAHARPWCDENAGEVTGWEEGSVVVSDYSAGSPRRLLIDAHTGEVLEVRLDDDRRGPIHQDRSVATFRESGEQVFVLEDRELWRVEAPEGYEVRASSVSPDGAWVAMVDDADRLLLAPTDGSFPPRLWIDDVSTWGPLVWEGT